MRIRITLGTRHPDASLPPAPPVRPALLSLMHPAPLLRPPHPMCPAHPLSGDPLLSRRSAAVFPRNDATGRLVIHRPPAVCRPCPAGGSYS